MKTKPITFNITKVPPYTVEPTQVTLRVLEKLIIEGVEKVKIEIVYTQQTQYGYNSIVEVKDYPIAFLDVVEGVDFETGSPKVNTVALRQILTQFGITLQP